MKIRNYFLYFSLFVITLFGCRKAAVVGSDSCVDRVQKVSETLNAYIQNPTVDNCSAYVDALRKYINTGACFGNAFYKEYEKTLQDLEANECK